jgi:acyl carrier protein
MTIKERVLKDIRKYIKSWDNNVLGSDITMDTKFYEDHELDAVLLTELAMQLEKRYNFPEIPLNTLRGLETVGQMVEYIEGKVKK